MSLKPVRTGILLLAMAFILATPALVAETSASPLPPGVSLSTEATTDAGFAGLSVRVFAGDRELKSAFGGAMVSINRQNVGWAPWSSDRMAPGRYLVTVAADGWYPVELRLELAEKTLVKLSFTLKRMTGFLHTEMSPADAELVIGGKAYEGHLIELPTGHYRATARRFAYRERELSFDIFEGSTTTLVAALERAPFEIGDLHPSRPAFDPANLGILGSTFLNFRVTSYGSGRIEILAPDGAPVARFDFPSFTDWDQSVGWNGRRQGGRREPLPDGRYVARLTATAAEQVGTALPAEAPPLVLETVVTLDSSLALSPFGTAGALPGLLYFPDPRRTGGGQAAVDLGFSAASALTTGLAPDASVDLGFAAAAGPGGLGLALALSTSDSPESGIAKFAAALSWRSTLSGPEAGRPGGSLALFLRTAWSGSVAAMDMPFAGLPADALSLELDLPWAWQSGSRDGAFISGLAPGLLVGYAPEGGAFLGAPRLRAGAFYSTRGVRLGLSAMAAPASFADLAPASLAWAAAAEFGAILAPSPLVLSVSAGGRGRGADVDSWDLRVGLGYIF